MFRIRLVYIYVLLAAILIVGVVACEGNGSKITVFQTENLDEVAVDEATIGVGKMALRISGGSGSYVARSSDPNTVAAWVANNYLHLVAKKTGLIEVTIVDGVDQTKTIKVNVEPSVRLLSVQESHAEVEIDSWAKDGKKVVDYIENLIEGQLKTRGMYYKLIYDELTSGRVVIYPKGLNEEFKIEGTFESEMVEATQTLFKIKINGFVREYNLIEIKENEDLTLKKGLFIENYSNNFRFKNVKVVKALGVETVYYQ